LSDPVAEGLDRIRAWGEARDWRGYDPYDALNSPVAHVFDKGPALGRRALTQAVKLSPVNLRPLLGIKPAWNAKAIALVASAYVRLAHGGDESARSHAERWLAWLADSSAEGGWGYHFPVQTRLFAYERGTPNTIATCFCAQAFLDAWELLGWDDAAGPALDARAFLVDRMLHTGPRPHFRYLEREDELVHNANLLACAVLARSSRLAGRSSLFDPAQEPVKVTLAAQRPDGSWPYADGVGHDWVDNFHTAYVLDALVECEVAMPDATAQLDLGVGFWERELFLGDGTPKYFPQRLLPVDAHCYATAVDTWLSLGRRRPDALERAERTALLLVERMLDPRGFVHFQRRRLWTSRVPLVRWTTAPSFRALAGLLAARSREADARLD
jgi:hypothetical protein